MALFESTLALLLGAVILTGVARRVGVPYPSLLAIAGAALAFVPAGPELEIEPDLALALFVTPSCWTRRSTPRPATCGGTSSHWCPSSSSPSA